MACNASLRLEPGDWAVIDFYGMVQDQVRNQAPMGTDSGKPYTTPVLTDWIAALNFYGFEPWVLDEARWLHQAMEERSSIRFFEAQGVLPMNLKTPEVGEYD